MKNLTDAIKAVIATKLGIEPVNILEVQWGNLWASYADKDITNYEYPIQGKILELSNLESIVKLDSQGQTQGIGVKLSDSDGNLKDIFDNTDIHGKRCILYQWFEGLPLSEKFKLYEGEISSPVTWGEGDRSLSFEVITQLTNKEVGFSPEEGYFEYIPESAYGKPWPLIFGTVQNVKATLLNEIPTAMTSGALAVADPTVPERLTELNQKLNEAQQLFIYYSIAAGVAAFTCYYGETADIRQQGCSTQDQLEQATLNLAQQIDQINNEKSELISIWREQILKQNSSLKVTNSDPFPTGYLTLKSGDVTLTGQFSGNTFIIDSLNLDNYTGYDGTPFGFTWQNSGTTITVKNDTPIIYIVNLIESEVLYVTAFKQTESGQVLTTVPADWFEVKTVVMGSYTITYIIFDKPLSSYDEAYTNDIYVTVKSDIGPNTVDIMEWLINTYTDLDIDTISFSHVKTLLENYPSHFALLDRKNILELLEDIAFQARCSIWISDRTFYLKYLPEEQTEVVTITEADIDAGSLSIILTETEELVTKLVAKWRSDYSNEEDNLIILRHNIKKYGTKEREIEFYIYNIYELVLKSATFWLIRLANVWKNLEFSVYLDKLELETFDTVKFNFSENFVADTAIKGTITSVNYDINNNILNLTSWLPVKCGSMSKYVFAEPHDISIDLFFPTQNEIDDGLAGGDGPGSDVEGGLELTSELKETIGFRTESSRRSLGERIQRDTFGDEIPSDADDEKPEPDIIEYDIPYSSDPGYSYTYPDYQLIEAEIEEDVEWSFSYPGKVTGKVSADIYNVAVYKFGLLSEPENVEVKQLQIDTSETIPNDTWVMVAYNRWYEGVGDDRELKSEYTMQVPIWL